MPTRKHSSKRTKRAFKPDLPLLAVSAGVIFFVLHLISLFAAGQSGALLAITAGLWLIGGVGFVAGVVTAITHSRWSLLLLAAPAVSFALCFVILIVAELGGAVVVLLGSLAA